MDEIEGISLMTKSEIMKTVPAKKWNIYSITLLVIAAIIFGFGLFVPLAFTTETNYKNILLFVGFINGALFFLTYLMRTFPPLFDEIHTGRYRYIIRIDDVKAKEEIYKNYIVVNSSDNIWVVNDKETYE